MKKFLALFLALMLCFAFVGCGGNDAAADGQQEDNTPPEPTTYGIGDTWEVEGQWKLTIDGVKVTDERNEWSEEDPAQVVVIDYTYENLGYEDQNGIMDGLYFDLDFQQIVDADGEMGYSYPVDVKYPDEVPVNARCSAQAGIGFNNEGNSFTMYVSQYDGNGKEQEATFVIEY